MARNSDRDEFFHAMGREGMKLSDARSLWRLSGRYFGLQERACNGDVPDLEAREQRIERQIIALTAAAGWPIPSFSGDPRGATVKVRVPSGRTNDWGGIGICVR